MGAETRAARIEPRECFAPQRQILIACSLHDVEARQIARAHPAHVSEINRRSREHLPQRTPREPLAFDERDRHPVARQQLRDLDLRPTAVAKLAREAHIRGLRDGVALHPYRVSVYCRPGWNEGVIRPRYFEMREFTAIA